MAALLAGFALLGVAALLLGAAARSAWARLFGVLTAALTVVVGLALVGVDLLGDAAFLIVLAPQPLLLAAALPALRGRGNRGLFVVGALITNPMLDMALTMLITW